MVLYKYRSDSDRTEEIIKRSAVWLSAAQNLNDPFECTIQEIAKPWIDDRVREGMQAHIGGFMFSFINAQKRKAPFFGLNPKQAREYIAKLKVRAKGDVEVIHRSISEFLLRKGAARLSDPRMLFKEFDAQLNRVGIFSLSEVPDNQLMWAHCGGESRGIAIGFVNQSTNKLGSVTHCVQVTYADEIPAFEGNGFIAQSTMRLTADGLQEWSQKISFDDPTFRKAICTKPTAWAYEREWRYIEEAAGSYPRPGPIGEIVFGLRCPEVVRDKYRQLAKDWLPRTVVLSEIRAIPNSNQIEKVVL